MSNPATAIGRSPTGVSTEKRHVVGHHIGLVALLVGEVAQSTLVGVGYCHNALCGLFFAHLLLKQVFEQTECYGWLGGCARL